MPLWGGYGAAAPVRGRCRRGPSGGPGGRGGRRWRRRAASTSGASPRYRPSSRRYGPAAGPGPGVRWSGLRPCRTVRSRPWATSGGGPGCRRGGPGRRRGPGRAWRGRPSSRPRPWGRRSRRARAHRPPGSPGRRWGGGWRPVRRRRGGCAGRGRGEYGRRGWCGLGPGVLQGHDSGSGEDGVHGMDRRLRLRLRLRLWLPWVGGLPVPYGIGLVPVFVAFAPLPCPYRSPAGHYPQDEDRQHQQHHQFAYEQAPEQPVPGELVRRGVRPGGRQVVRGGDELTHRQGVSARVTPFGQAPCVNSPARPVAVQARSVSPSRKASRPISSPSGMPPPPPPSPALPPVRTSPRPAMSCHR